MKKRLDVLMVERGLAESRERAQALVLAGEVSVNGDTVHRVAQQVDSSAEITVKEPLPYERRGG